MLGVPYRKLIIFCFDFLHICAGVFNRMLRLLTVSFASLNKCLYSTFFFLARSPSFTSLYFLVVVVFVVSILRFSFHVSALWSCVPFFDIPYLFGSGFGVGCYACFRVLIVGDFFFFSSPISYGFKWMVSANVRITKRLATLSEWLFTMKFQWKCEFSASLIWWIHYIIITRIECVVYAVHFMLQCVCVCVPYMQASRQKYIRCVFFFLFQTICGSNKPIPYFVVVVALPDYMSQKSQSPFGKACDLPLLFPPALCLRFYFCCLLRSICVWWQMSCPLWVLSFIAMLSMQMTTCLRIFLRQMWQKFMVFSVLKEYGKCSLGMASHHRYV